MSESTETVLCDEATPRKETTKAELWRIDGKDTWIPKSFIHDRTERERRDGTEIMELEVQRWFVEREGLA